MKIIVYGSKYGSARRYAEELSNRTFIEARSFSETKNLHSCDTIIYVGGLYAGEVLGLYRTIRAIPQDSAPFILIATVGLSDPKDVQNIKNIRDDIKKKMPEHLYERTKIIHLPGKIDHAKLGFMDRLRVRSLYLRIKNTLPKNRTTDIERMLHTYGKDIDLTDMDALNEITEILWSIRPKTGPT
ncbi:MAG: flavodoxin domain-containing protein [Peptostreptococcaceae bacterium]|nr:flavodoxin domain-containing protein [Peptostreptococcaceae bacterium]